MMLVQDDKSLQEIRSFLTAITGRILQLSDHKAGVALGAATSTLAGTTAASTIMGIVGTLGSASTGTTLASLAGAAKTSATRVARIARFRDRIIAGKGATER